MCEYKNLVTGVQEITHDHPVRVVIPDEVEGDMEFIFRLSQNYDRSSYTSYKVIDEHHGEILVSNVKYQGVRTSKPMCVGTYKKQYYLYIDLVVFAEPDEEWQIEYTFKIRFIG